MSMLKACKIVYLSSNVIKIYGHFLLINIEITKSKMYSNSL